MLAFPERHEERADIVLEPTLSGTVAGSVGTTSATFAADVVPPREVTFWMGTPPETGEKWRTLIAHKGFFISFAKGRFMSDRLEGVGIFRMEKPLSDRMDTWGAEWKGLLGRFEEHAPLLVVFDPLARSLSTESLLEEIETTSSGVRPQAAEILRGDQRLAIPIRDILRRIGAPLRRLAMPKPPEVDAFADPDARGPPIVRIVVRAPTEMKWEDQMRAWDRLSEFVDGLLPTRELKRRVIVSVEPS